MNDIQTTNVKRRGRKPKGGRLIQNIPIDETLSEDKSKTAIIVHLKCSSKDLQETNTDFAYNPNLENIAPYTEINTSYKYTDFEISQNEKCQNVQEQVLDYPRELFQYKHHNQDENYRKCKTEPKQNTCCKIANLSIHLENMNLNHVQSSCCFWCTYEFSNKPYHIPKSVKETTINVYGNFCSPECAMAYLLHENLDDTEKLERSHLLNYVYPSNTNQNIKPALNPYYSLNRFFGTLTITEFRELSSRNKHYTLVDKPMTLVNPELHEDTQQISCTSL